MKSIIQMGRSVLGRLHVAVGYVRQFARENPLLAIAVVAMTVAICPARAADFPVASAPGWRTTLFLSAPNASAPATVTIPQYLTGPRTITLVPGGAATPELTLAGGYGILSLALPDGVDAFVRLDYDAATHSSYTTKALVATHGRRYYSIQNDGPTQTVVTALCKVPTPITVTPHNEVNASGGHEYFLCAPPVTQYVLVQTVTAGSLEVAVGNIPFDDGSAWGAAYFLVSVGKADRDAFVLP